LAELWQGLIRAIELIITLDPEVMKIASKSLTFAAASCSIATLVFLPLGAVIHFNRFYGKRVLLNIIQTFYSVPTVAVGLFVFVFISNAGPFGSLGLLFTPSAIIIGQVLLVSQ
jgi:tungstate transport system permease protein